MKKLLFIIFCFICFNINIEALTYSGCDYGSISRLKSLVNNVNITYDYHIDDGIAYFDITLNNVPEDAYFEDSISTKKYTYSDTNNGEITIRNYNAYQGKYTFYADYKECSNTKIGTKYYNLPHYNIYYESSLCKDIPNYSLCQKWAKVNYSYSEFEVLVYKYKEAKEYTEKEEQVVVYKKTMLDKIIDLYTKNYYIILGGTIAICLIIILVKNRKGRFKL